jgi:hypothetical protein
VALVLLLLTLLGPIDRGSPAAGQSLPSDIEYQIKASFVYTVAKFVDWPERAFPPPGTPLTLGIVGSDTASDAIALALRGKRVHDRELQVRRLYGVPGACDCQILYYASGEGSVGAAAAPGKGAPAGVLTVGESSDFTSRGGILEITMQESMVQFEVNIAAAQKAGLVISSKILRLGHVVGGPVPTAEARP